ncbi:Glucoamylase [Verticillium dahliae VDG1]|nr:Glucoamylase [Verticillium dahliae VDG1]
MNYDTAPAELGGSGAGTQNPESLASQVEGLLKESNTRPFNPANWANLPQDQWLTGVFDDFLIDPDIGMAKHRASIPGSESLLQNAAVPGLEVPPTFAPSGELMALGLTEPLPPFELMEEMNNTYFQRQHPFLPMIHPGRYFQAFYSVPHKRPPMCLQYAIWATASNGHEKYSQYHDVFYKRARQYADNDEMRGYGEHFVTIAHAQTWGLLAMTEARSMLFTRAAMSSAKAVRLVEMMDLHRIDGAGHDVAPTLAPPKDWTDVEERRRVFWGVFTIDCHASISTGWPTLIDPHDITTNLPSSEEAFNECREERTSSLAEAFSGAWYSTFSGPIIICHIFNEILRHVHRTKATDRLEDVEYGGFWHKHRKLDNIISSAFMFMPERFRLPKNLRNPTAVHTNLNLHAGIICLHHAAVDKVETYNLPESLRIASQSRLRTAAEEIVNIVRLSSHVSPGFKSPLAALSMYCAVSVYVYIAKISPQSGLSRTDLNNLEFLINAMESIAKNHLITQAFLQQICADVEMNGLASVINLPSLANHRNAFGWSSPNVPLLVKSYLTKHTGIQPPLSGRLPPGNRHPSTARPGQSGSSVEELNDPPGFSDVLPRSAQDIPGKRKRPAQPTQFPENPGAEYDNINFNDVGTHTNEFFSRSRRGMYGSGLLRATGVAPRVNTRPVVLPHRTSTTASPSRYNISTPSQATSGDTPGPSMGFVEGEDTGVGSLSHEGLPPLASAVPPSFSGAFGMPSSFMFSPDENSMGDMPLGAAGAAGAGIGPSGVDPWTMLAGNDEGSWPSAGLAGAKTN